MLFVLILLQFIVTNTFSMSSLYKASINDHLINIRRDACDRYLKLFTLEVESRNDNLHLHEFENLYQMYYQRSRDQFESDCGDYRHYIKRFLKKMFKKLKQKHLQRLEEEFSEHKGILKMTVNAKFKPYNRY